MISTRHFRRSPIYDGTCPDPIRIKATNHGTCGADAATPAQHQSWRLATTEAEQHCLSFLGVEGVLAFPQAKFGPSAIQPPHPHRGGGLRLKPGSHKHAQDENAPFHKNNVPTDDFNKPRRSGGCTQLGLYILTHFIHQP